MKRYAEEDWFELSALQHFIFCSRQFALIHIEKLWQDNAHTMRGNIFHERAHNPELSETRPGLLIRRAMRVHSETLGVSGECDVVEFQASDIGISLSEHDGFWTPVIIEYKSGRPFSGSPEDSPDCIQLCCQAMCLAEMLCCDIDYGFLFYEKSRRRIRVDFSEIMKQKVRDSLAEMHRLYDRRHTPKVKPKKYCQECSLYDECAPKIFTRQPIGEYMKSNLEAE